MFNYYSKFIVFFKVPFICYPCSNFLPTFLNNKILYENFIFFTTVKPMILTDDKIKQLVPVCAEGEEGLQVCCAAEKVVCLWLEVEEGVGQMERSESEPLK